LNELQPDYDSPWKEAIAIPSMEEFQQLLEQPPAIEDNSAGEN
jgi:hypothetical protein